MCGNSFHCVEFHCIGAEMVVCFIADRLPSLKKNLCQGFVRKQPTPRNNFWNMHKADEYASSVIRAGAHFSPCPAARNKSILR